MKKIIYILCVIALLCSSVLTCFAADEETTYNYETDSYYTDHDLAGTSINVFNWGEYISDSYEDDCIDVNAEFERITGITVNYVTFESNEDMYAKIANGGVSYDIVIPSDYMIERMISEDLLLEVDVESLPNYENIMDDYKNVYFDPDNSYTVPYSVGMVGLIYNTTMVDETPTSWDILWDEDYAGQILMIDNVRDAFAIPLKMLGYSLNTTDEAELQEAADMLIEQKSLLQSYVMDEVYNKMESGEAAMVPYYVGDYVSMKEVNDDLAFVYPEEGVNIFIDSVCIPTCAQNYDAALMYMNFLMEPEVALSNALYIGYATPNAAVLEMDEYAEMLAIEELYPAEGDEPDVEYFENLPQETLDVLSTLWSDIKVSGSDMTSIYIGLGVVAIAAAAFLVYKSIQKKKRDY
ncbi:MAG: spermidine/putrescine ABC transporter substrate-binding protein [Clostridia bacterium]